MFVEFLAIIAIQVHFHVFNQNVDGLVLFEVELMLQILFAE